MTTAPPALKPPKQILRNALREQMPLYRKAMFFSLVGNLLVLAPTLYMLEVYDRVLNSRSAVTLVMLVLAVTLSYLLMEALELVRAEIMLRAGRRVDESLRSRLFDSTFVLTLARGGVPNTQVFNDLRTIREFVGSNAAFAIMELPAGLFFLVIVTWIHWVLGVCALVGAMIQVWIAFRTERQTMPGISDASRSAIQAQVYATTALRSTQVIEAMGMMGAIRGRWMRLQRKFLDAQANASEHAAASNAISRFVQTAQGSLLLGVACWIAIQPSWATAMSGGTMIVSSILGGRVLAPLVQLVAQWRLVVDVRDAYRRLSPVLDTVDLPVPGMPLPPPAGELTVESVFAAAPGTQAPILRGVSFAAKPGEVVMVLGPSAAGKSTLARLLTGVWPAQAGKVRLDSADVYAWNKEELGPHVGYLPQGVELFDGTIAENIARFGRVDMDQVTRAGTMAGLDAWISQLPDGYETLIGDDGAFLSGGQRQRVALARAVYGQPRLLVLDEPNSSLDEAGERSLLETLGQLKADGRTVVVISHRSSILPAVDRMLVLREGQVMMFGPRDEVLAQIQQAAAKAQAQAQAAARPPAPAGGRYPPPVVAGRTGGEA